MRTMIFLLLMSGLVVSLQQQFRAFRYYPCRKDGNYYVATDAVG